MAQINFTVPTEPLAREIDGVTNNVQVVGTAVTAMQAAVIASEKMASDKICNSIDSGFFMLMRSRLSQRIAQFASTMNSRTGSMMETAAAIDNTHRQMQGDFNRIKARYVKLFDRLDRNLEQRIRELDRPAMSIARKRGEFLFDLPCRIAPSAIFYATDTAQTSLKLSNARMKARAQDSIGDLSEGSRTVVEWERATADVMEPNTPAGTPLVCVPVVYTVEETLAAPGTFQLSIQTPDDMAPETQVSIVQGVRARQDVLEGSSAQDLAAIRSSYAQKVTEAGIDQRTADAMMRLFDQSFFPGAGSGQQG